MWLIAGLGNFGDKYYNTRHNVGFFVADYLHEKEQDSTPFSNKFEGFFTATRLADQKVGLLKPQTYMNLSGRSVQAAMQFYKIKPDNIIVVHDELDLPFGAIRIKQGGGHGGHNGIRDIIQRIGNDFIRIRLGIGKPVIKGTEASYVLSKFRVEELLEVEKMAEKACQSAESVITKGVEATQQLFNQK